MSQITAWAHLPNAAHIDEVLASLKAHPEKWSVAWYAARNAARNAAWNAAWDAAWDAARDAVQGAVLDATLDATRDAAWATARDADWSAALGAALGAAWYAPRDAAWYAPRDAIAALIAYDDAGQFMKLPVEQLKAMHRLDPHPMYLLLQPAAIVFRKGTT